MELNIKTVRQIDVSDWDKFVSDHYGKIYNFQQQDGCKPRGVETISVPAEWWSEEDEDDMPDSIPFKVNGKDWGVKFKVWLETSPKDTEKHFERDHQNGLFWERNFYPNIGAIINDLHSKGLLAEGDYQIKIDW